jgi:phenylacetate-CoA ligase
MQSYATADVGLIAYESREPGGSLGEGMIVDEGILLELVEPGTGNPVAAGEVGEVVVTSFNRDYPLIRFALGDLSAVLPGPSPCGRTNTRLKGWLGRADQSVKVRGMFVHPSQIAEIVRRHPEILRARLVVDRHDEQDRMTLHCEVRAAPPGLADTLAGTAREVTKLRAAVELREPGILPQDGRVIEDARRYGAGS